MADTTAKKPPRNKDYERLGRVLESVFASEFISRAKLYWINFSRGIFFGFGAALGGTFLIALVIWILSFFTELPLVGNLIEAFNNAVESKLD